MFYNINTDSIEVFLLILEDFTIKHNITHVLHKDYTGVGFKDLRAGFVRTPLDPVSTFSDDPLRILRAIRFASRYTFTIDPVLVFIPELSVLYC